jgi:hypothetical protein
MSIEIERAIPILRIFDIAKPKAFYVDYLGCTIPSLNLLDPFGNTLRFSEHKAE